MNHGGPKMVGLNTTREVLFFRDKLMAERRAEIAKERAMNPRAYVPAHELDVQSHFPVFETYLTMTMKGKGLNRTPKGTPSSPLSERSRSSPASRCSSAPGLHSLRTVDSPIANDRVTFNIPDSDTASRASSRGSSVSSPIGSRPNSRRRPLF